MMGECYVRKYLVLFQVALLLLQHVSQICCNGPIYRTMQGEVQGFTQFVNGKKVDTFYGIPYAKPPVKEWRYKLPRAPDNFDGVLNATVLPNSCMQVVDDTYPDFIGTKMWNANTPQSEDCLYLNVWVPKVNPPYQNKSVIVWIYGGSYNSGTSSLDIYQAHYLAAENDVIVVSLNYRVGSLGFLALNTEDAPGNAGIHDMLMALQWVEQNIHNFGGSSTKVTLMGESAGAVSIGILMICQICQSKFQRAILQSGSSQANWGVLPKDEIINRSIQLAKHVGCYVEGDHNYMLKCLQSKNASDFSTLDLRMAFGIIQFPFVPVIDGVLVLEDPQKTLDKGGFNKIPILLGSNENEATYFLMYEHDEFNHVNVKHPEISLKLYTELINSKLFKFYPFFPYETTAVVRDAIAHRYRNWLQPDNGFELVRSLDRAVSDCYFVCPVNYLARSYARHNMSVYYYWFNHRWVASPWNPWLGVLHADEIWFVFGHPLNASLSFTAEERQLSLDMMRYWANFAKTGDPNEPGTMRWPQFRINEQAYLNFTIGPNPGNYYIGHGPRVQECAFWDVHIPMLMTQTRNISEAESEWKIEFNEWKTKYIVDWKTQFDQFLQNYQRRMGSCSGGRP